MEIGNGPSEPSNRHGFALLPTLALLLLLAAITLALQSRSQTSLRLLSRLTTDLHDRAAQDALTDRLRGLVGDAMASPAPLPGRPRLDGTPFAMDWAGQSWQVRVQDVEGLVELYLAAPETLALLPADARAREAALAALPPGTRFPTLAMALARFGIDPTQAAGLVTQSGRTGTLRLSTLPEDLRPRAKVLRPGPREGEQITRVQLRFEKPGG
ncbi:hypothetical protein [Xinfangfangia pollutisoli]|uniref:hypothetical protein n=1 Tax=Xinfangfangia pollutisoli TaxID=2865960 RepID=UPI001CD65B2D|nr:hypothetical protein [Xinfangfangia pollutisoli]